MSNKGRAGSRKVRVFIFREWLLQTYGSYLFGETGSEDANGTHSSDLEASANGHSRHTPRRKRNRTHPSFHEETGPIVLDVAGGKGDLSWLLKNVDGLESVVVDPWKPDPKTVSRNERMTRSVEYLRSHPEECQTRSVPGLLTFQPLAGLLPRLLEQRSQRLQHRRRTQPQHRQDNNECIGIKERNASQSSSSLPAVDEPDSGSQEILSSNANGPCRPEDFLTPRVLHVPLDASMVQRVRDRIAAKAQPGQESLGKNTDGHASMYNYDSTADKDTAQKEEEVDSDDKTALELLASGRIRLVVGFHPDQATEPCLDLAGVLGVPFCVVPCCVFPSEFPHRRVPPRDNGATGNDGGEEGVPVRTYTQFLEYLRAKATRLPASRGRTATLHTACLDFPFTETAKNVVLYTLPQPEQHA